MLRYWVVILIGLGIDGIQILISLGLTGMGSAVSVATFGFAGPVVLPLTTAISFVVAITISATFGSGLMLLLAYNGMFYPKYAFSGGIAELMPGIDIVPAWTLTTILAVVQKVKEEKKKAASAATSTTSVRGGFGASRETPVRTRPIYKQQEEGEQRAPMPESQKLQPSFSNMRLVDGITAPRAALPASEPLNYAR